MAEVTTAYPYDEVKRMRAEYGETAEVPRAPLGATAGMLKVQQPIADRIADLSKQVAEAAMRLSEARSRHREVSDQRSKSEVEFAQVADDLLRAIHEHREGTPEKEPYQP